MLGPSRSFYSMVRLGTFKILSHFMFYCNAHFLTSGIHFLDFQWTESITITNKKVYTKIYSWCYCRKGTPWWGSWVVVWTARLATPAGTPRSSSSGTWTQLNSRGSPFASLKHWLKLWGIWNFSDWFTSSSFSSEFPC